MERSDFVAEGNMQIGPKENFFTLLDGEYLGQLLLSQFGFSKEPDYTNVGRVRITVERLEE